MTEIINEQIDGLLKATSRSFHLTLTNLPKSVRDQVGFLYLLARLADTIADSKTEDVNALIEALDGYQNCLIGNEILDLQNIANMQEDLDEKRLLENLDFITVSHNSVSFCSCLSEFSLSSSLISSSVCSI